MNRPRVGCLPDFLVIGPQRTATTWLHEAIAKAVGLPDGVKETMFFDRYYHKGLEWYRAHFLQCPPDLPTGEVAPTYFHSPTAPARIRAANPGCKIVCTLREPISRTYSLYLHMRAYGLTNLPFERALDECPVLLDSSYYAHHVERWTSAFGSESVLVLFNDDLVADAQTYISTFCRFIGVPTIVLDDARRRPVGKETSARSYLLTRTINTVADRLRQERLYVLVNLAKRLGLRRLVFEGGKTLPPLDAEMRARLALHFRPQIDELERLLGRDLSDWREAAAQRAQ